ncbi:MAG: formyltransferase family protein [Actinomycetota bacterium]
MSFKIGWFSTGRDQAAIDLFETISKAIRNGTTKGEVAFVFSNRIRGEAVESERFFDVVEGYGIPLIQFSSKNFKPDRIAFDREVMKRLEGYDPALVVLAGYMLIVGPEMCRKYRMINLHPALPDGPVGTWEEVIWKLVHAKATETGAMMHLVTPELDKGPPISYYSFPIRGEEFDALWEKEDKQELFDEIRRQGVIRELPLILFTIREFTDGNLTIQNGKVLARGKRLEKGYDLTKQIEQWITKRGQATFILLQNTENKK